jgi:HSP20 family molecular chaperone IbpA
MAGYEKENPSFLNGVLNIEVPKMAAALKTPKRVKIKKAA